MIDLAFTEIVPCIVYCLAVRAVVPRIVSLAVDRRAEARRAARRAARSYSPIRVPSHIGPIDSGPDGWIAREVRADRD